MDKIKVAIATPYHNNVPVPFHLSMVTLMTEFHKCGWELAMLSVDRTNCVQARNTLMEMFLSKYGKINFDYIFHIDSDIVFGVDDFCNILKHIHESQLDILSGVYRQRGFGKTKKHLTVALKNVDGKYYFLPDLPDGICEVDAIGFGFMVCKPTVYTHLFKKHGKHVFEYLKRGEEMISEDIVWCERAKELGYKINIDSDVVVGHYGVI